MSRGGFDIDDFRDSDWDSDWYSRESFAAGREVVRGRGSSQASAQSRYRLAKFRDAESRSDQISNRSSDQRVRHDAASRDNRDLIESRRERGKYHERDRTYFLRPSEIRTLTEIAKFRVVRVEDLAQFAYNGGTSRMESELRNLAEQGLVQRRGTSAFKKQSRRVLTVTKQAVRLMRRHEFLPEDQAVYYELVKPKEADHDAALYRLYQKAAAEIESKGGKILRVQLDYELKEKLWRKLGQARLQDKTEAFHLKQGYAQQMYLPVVQGKVSFPDLSIEYANQDMEISRVDLELATGHYHAGHLSEKARASFQIYARPEDAAGLRRVRDEREIMTSILSL